MWISFNFDLFLYYAIIHLLNLGMQQYCGTIHSTAPIPCPAPPQSSLSFPPEHVQVQSSVFPSLQSGHSSPYTITRIEMKIDARNNIFMIEFVQRKL
ncbi:CLUMA_CG012978, isoform A [Clunio marinus]|uniref:CLUMA_CG012978, isoform A n=1 Tax=Clunio marinus TaxID=568069 RepID=A0A1J1IHU1_9DIPT|nr:CLUMA_CG012978, isoform A [Clunio marinus]